MPIWRVDMEERRSTYILVDAETRQEAEDHAKELFDPAECDEVELDADARREPYTPSSTDDVWVGGDDEDAHWVSAEDLET